MLGEEHLSRIGTVTSLVGLYRLQGKYSHAEVLFSEALRLGEEQHPETLRHDEQLSALYREQSAYGKAEPVFTRVLERRWRVLG